MWRRWLLLTVGLGALTGLGIGADALRGAVDSDEPKPVVTHGPPGDAVPPDAVPAGRLAWEGVALVGDRRLAISFTGGNPEFDPSSPCWIGYRAEVEEDAERVVLTLRTFRSPTELGENEACTAEGHSRSLEVDLSEPLGRRHVFDGAARRGEAVVVAGPLSEVTFVPRGWELRSSSGRSDAEGWLWSRVYSSSPGQPKTVELLSVIEGTRLERLFELPPAESERSRTVRVHGREARLHSLGSLEGAVAGQQLLVVWQEAGRELAVAMVGAEADEPTVLALAEGVRVPTEDR